MPRPAARPAPAAAAAVLADPRAPHFTQDRARRTYEALIAAASDGFVADGYDATGTPEIARRAGVSVGTFYRYFDDKQQVFLEVSRRHLAAGYERILERLTPERFLGKARAATIAHAVEVLCGHVAQFPAMQRVFFEMALRDPEVARQRQAFDALSCARLTELITAITPRARVPPRVRPGPVSSARRSHPDRRAIRVAPPAGGRTTSMHTRAGRSCTPVAAPASRTVDGHILAQHTCVGGGG